MFSLSALPALVTALVLSAACQKEATKTTELPPSTTRTKAPAPNETDAFISFMERENRDSWQRPDLIIEALGLAGDEVIAEPGAGSGYFTMRLAGALPRGKVLATDVEQELVDHIRRRTAAAGLDNIDVRLTGFDDPGVSAEADIVFVCNLIYHIDDLEAWLGKLHGQMSGAARLVVVEFKEGDLDKGPPTATKIPKAQILEVMQKAGFELRSFDDELLPYHMLLTFDS